MNATGRISPLEQALAWWTAQDDMGGFKALAEILFPDWTPARSCRAPHREDLHPSFSIYQRDDGAWRFKDFGDDAASGGLVGFVMLAGLDQRAASQWLIYESRFQTGNSIPFTPRAKIEKAPDNNVLPDIPDAVNEKWLAGIYHLRQTPEAVQQLAYSRGWPVAWVEYLVGHQLISAPINYGEHTTAFLVEAPDFVDSGDSVGHLVSRPIGYHARHEDETGGKAYWTYLPNEEQFHQRTPALPFILGVKEFCLARLLIITEGQWDALTFAFAAGWLGEGCVWPAGVAVIGIRGATGYNTFLRHYLPYWPANANCLLLPDADAAGQKWHAGDRCFAQRLRQVCQKLSVVTFEPHKDFNDLYREGKVTPDQVAEIIAAGEKGLNAEGLT